MRYTTTGSRAMRATLALTQLLAVLTGLTGVTRAQQASFRANGAEVNYFQGNRRSQMLVMQVQQTTTVTYIATPMSSALAQFIINNPRGLVLASQRANQRIQQRAMQNIRFRRAGLDRQKSGSSSGRHTMFIGTKPASLAMGDDKTLIDFLLDEIFFEMGFSRQQQADAMRDIIVYNKQGDFLRGNNIPVFTPPQTPGFAQNGQGAGAGGGVANNRSPSQAPGSTANNPLTCQDSVEITCDQMARFRTADGTCNNLRHDLWGSSFIPMRRFIAPQYGDGISAPRTDSVTGGLLPSARAISAMLHPAGPDGELTQLTHMVMQWGQFLDHDLTSTPVQTAADEAALTCCVDEAPAGARNLEAEIANRTACFPIPILANDPFFVGRTCFSFPRSVQVTNANCQQSPVEQLNQITAYIDASQVYGSSDEEQASLRAFRGGLLKVSQENLLPKHDEEVCVLNNPSTDYCFMAGDTRVNEQMGLTSIQTVWMRQHNRLARQLSNINPHWDDERIFQVARKIVGALLQKTTYEEWLPIVLSQRRMQQFRLYPRQSGQTNIYDSNIDASIRNVFATAALRFGHSLIRTTMSQLTANYQNAGWWRLGQVFGNTSQILQSQGIGIDMYMRGLVRDRPNMVDRFFTSEIQNHLFQDSVGDSADLVAFNIQRGRDHGLPAYNAWRRYCGLRPASSFNDMPDHDRFSSQRFSQIYRHVDDIDVFTGAISEQPEGNGLVGPVLACLLSQQFFNLKFGDRFWYETADPNTGFTPSQLDQIRKHSFSRVMCDVTAITAIQPNPFRQVSFGNPMVNCQDLPEMNVLLWEEGGRGLGQAQWGTWSSWSQCSQGLQGRVRSCSQGGRQGLCSGRGQDSRTCNDLGWTAQWSQWSSWFDCTQGFQRRTRVCQGFANPCPGNPEDSRTCRGGFGSNTRNSPRGGLFSDQGPPGWTDWAPWSNDCRQGKQWRSRTCERTSGGEAAGECVGPSNNSRTCNGIGDRRNPRTPNTRFDTCRLFNLPAFC